MKFIEIVIDDEHVELPLGCRLVSVDIDKPGMIPFRCKQGICGTCRVQVLEGRENLSVPSAEETAFLKRLGHEDDSIRLACQITASGPMKISICEEYKRKRKLS